MPRKKFYIEERVFDVLGPQDWIHILSDPDLEFLGYGAEEVEETRESVLSELRKGNNLVLYHLWKRIESRAALDDAEEYNDSLEALFAGAEYDD
jgi:hypothetical protein